MPAVVDLAAMRNAMADLGGDPSRINPQLPAELVIDHSVQVDEYATARAMFRNAELEFERNRERYAFLRWGQTAFDNFKVVPPNTGIVHQVNLEFLARVIETRDGQAFPDTLVGTDSHTTMVNGLGVLGWGVGGIEAEAAMLGEAVSMLMPQVVGFRLTGSLPEGATATDLVLTVTQLLRAAGVVGKFVEYFGHGLVGLPARRPRDDREHVARVRRDLRLLPGGRRDAQVPAADRDATSNTSRSSRRTARRTRSGTTPITQPEYSQVVELDLSHGRAVARRAAPAAGPCAAARREAVSSSTRWRASASTTATGTTRRWRSRSPPAIRPTTVDPGHGSLMPDVQVPGSGGRRSPEQPDADGGRRSTARSSSSSTGRW